MGKKGGSSAPAVDPRVGIAMERQAALAEKQQAWYENEIYPWLLSQTEKQNQWSEEDRKFSKENALFYQNLAREQTDKQNARADQYYDRWNEKYRPLEDTMLDDVRRYNGGAEAERQAGLAIADATEANAKSRQMMAMNMATMGVDPSSGRYMNMMNSQATQQAAMRAAAANQARQAAEALGWQKKTQLGQMGQQYIANSLNASGQAASSLGTIGGLANQSVGQASQFGQLGTQNITNLSNVGLSSYQSLGNAWGNYGNLGMQVSNYNLNAWDKQQQAKQAAASSTMSMVGTVAGAAIAAF